MKLTVPTSVSLIAKPKLDGQYVLLNQSECGRFLYFIYKSIHLIAFDLFLNRQTYVLIGIVSGFNEVNVVCLDQYWSQTIDGYSTKSISNLLLLLITIYVL